jgi:hypothetical protein
MANRVQSWANISDPLAVTMTSSSNVVSPATYYTTSSNVGSMSYKVAQTLSNK